VKLLKDVFVSVKTERTIIEQSEIVIKIPLGVDPLSEEGQTLINSTVDKFMKGGKAKQSFKIHAVKVPVNTITGIYHDKDRKIPLKANTKTK